MDSVPFLTLTGNADELSPAVMREMDEHFGYGSDQPDDDDMEAIYQQEVAGLSYPGFRAFTDDELREVIAEPYTMEGEDKAAIVREARAELSRRAVALDVA